MPHLQPSAESGHPVVAAVDAATVIEIGDLLWQDMTERGHQFSQELRLVSPSGEWLEYLVGALYLNGTLASSYSGAVAVNGLGNTTNKWLGRAYDGQSSTKGYYDDMRIYGRTLSPPADWDCLPPGDALLTRRVKAAGPRR